MGEQDWLAEQFEAHRTRLRAVAYRMLGSATEADDAVQDAWLRFSHVGANGVNNLSGWLTTLVARACLDLLRARASRQEQPLGVHVPDPVISRADGIDPEQQALMAEGVGVALLVVLETLTPAERLAFVLHDMFAVPFSEIAGILECTPDHARQYASRGRRRVRGAAPTRESDLAEQRRLVSAFLAASRDGDFDALVALLDPDVVFRVRGRTRPATVHGATDVARRVLARGTPLAPQGRPALVNGTPGVIVGPVERLFSVVSFTIARGRIASVDVIVGPATM